MRFFSRGWSPGHWRNTFDVESSDQTSVHKDNRADANEFFHIYKWAAFHFSTKRPLQRSYQRRRRLVLCPRSNALTSQRSTKPPACSDSRAPEPVARRRAWLAAPVWLAVRRPGRRCECHFPGRPVLSRSRGGFASFGNTCGNYPREVKVRPSCTRGLSDGCW